VTTRRAATAAALLVKLYPKQRILGPVMSSEHPIEVEDLVAACRAENAKRAFGEAVAAFRTGAYRGSIVLTWIAVVFDYVGKLRELELTGNGEAAKALSEWETARCNSDFHLAMRLEDQMLGEAETKFGLLSPIERQDLERLRLDRHRCVPVREWTPVEVAKGRAVSGHGIEAAYPCILEAAVG
jgi:hypothetical protein